MGRENVVVSSGDWVGVTTGTVDSVGVSAGVTVVVEESCVVPTVVGSPAVGVAGGDVTESVGVGSAVIVPVVCSEVPDEAVGGEDSGCAVVVVGTTTCAVVVPVWVFVRLGLGVVLLEVVGR